MRVLVTGAEGFVGRHIAARSRREGWDTTTVDLVTGDDCRTVFADRETFDRTFHCAATVGGRAAIDGTPLDIAQNMGVDAELFRWATGCCPHVIYFSSSAVYPTMLQRQAGTRLAESMGGPGHPGAPDAVYGWSKLVGEVMADQARREGVTVDVWRPFSGYGADQDLCYPFPAFVERARRREDPFQVWGSTASARDWVHISDVVAAVFDGLGHDGVLNICTGQATTFGELAAMMCEAVGYRPEVVEVPGPRGVFWRVGDPAMMAYTPVVSIEEGCRRAIE